MRSIALTMAILATPALAAPNPLAAERDRTRPLVVVAPSPSDPAFVSLTKALASRAAALAERQIVVFTVIGGHGERAGRAMDPAASSSLLAALGLHATGPTTALLIGKDGGVKLKGRLSVESVIAAVDQMPMRRQEMKTKGRLW
jgi:hypothetical protein